LPLDYWGFRAGPEGLQLGAHVIAAVADRVGTPFYLFDQQRLRTNIRRALESARRFLPGAMIFYSFKTNPHSRVLEIMREENLGAEVISARELRAAETARFPADRIVFNGPGKTDADLHAAAERGVLVQIESASEARALARVASASTRPVRAGIRLNPDVFDDRLPTSVRMGSRGAVFGLDPAGAEFNDAVAVLAGSPQVRLETLSAHIGTGIISAEPYRKLVRALMATTRRLAARGVTVGAFDVGGGFAVPSEVRYAHGAFDALEVGEPVPVPAPESVASFAEVCAAIAEELRETSSATVMLEPGRLLVSDAFHLITRVTRLKDEGGTHFAILDASRAQNALFVGRGYHEMLHARRPVDEDGGRYTVTGPLCAAFDVFARARALPRLAEGDVVVLCDVGAYNLSAQSQWSFDPAPVVTV